MAEFVCIGCGRTGVRGNGVQWYEGSVRDVELDRDDTAIEDGEFLCDDCFRRLDPEDQPRWRPLHARTASTQSSQSSRSRSSRADL